jgi:endonuclease YncB( thermonuclease family)
LAASAIPAAASDLAGRAQVVDGDTLEIAGQPIRLAGIDAPELDQTCTVLDRVWNCGQEAMFALAFEIGTHWIACNERGRDSDGTVVAVCTAGPYDLAERMVRNGWALVDESAADGAGYRAALRQARDFGSGLWRGGFIAPADWRRGKR